jgi:hypothetical protein
VLKFPSSGLTLIIPRSQSYTLSCGYETLRTIKHRPYITSRLLRVNRRVLESQIRSRRLRRAWIARDVLVWARHAVLLSCRQLDQQIIRIKKQPFGSILPPSRLMVGVATAGTPFIVLTSRKDAHRTCHDHVFFSFLDYV